ncbi:hypothetical protein M0R45_035621 [Rubus argutus]|uniref:Uncharacterized protein n=1 Tax=Rubus argutus TaxID=59490 RepID=A0AAW1VTQ5_RUBAR
MSILFNRRFLKSHQKNPSIKNSFGGMHWNPCHLEINRDLLMTLLESLPKKYPASSEEPRTNFIFMATAGYPLWILSSTDSNAYHPETLNYFRVLAHVSERSMVTNAQILEILSPGEEESYKERTQVMSAEFVLPTPKVPAREAQFVPVFSPTTGRKLDHCRCLRG